MAGRTIKYSWLLLIGSLLFSQNMINRLRVPIQIRTAIGFGYDSNFIRLPYEDICIPNMGTCGYDVEKYGVADVSEYGISSTLDSPILKPTFKLIYSPIVMREKTMNIITAISYSHFSQAAHKSASIQECLRASPDVRGLV